MCFQLDGLLSAFAAESLTCAGNSVISFWLPQFTSAAAVAMIDYPYIWFWNPSPMRTVNRKGQRCRVLVRGAMNSALIQFEDGFRVVASRNALRRVI